MDNNINYEILNEEMSAVATKRIRDAIHDIVVALKRKETIDVEEMSKILAADYKITISPFFLDKFLEEFMRAKRGLKNDTFFSRSDNRWLGIREFKGAKEIRNNLLYQKPALSKYKRKLFSEDEAKKLEKAYQDGMPELNFKEEVIRQTFILQKPEDSKEMMKTIYSDVIIAKKYYNTYDNCWKLMVLLGKQGDLDRRTGWFRQAPQSVKDHYVKTKAQGVAKLDLELKVVPKTNQTTAPKKPEFKPDETKDISAGENINFVKTMAKCPTWDDFTTNIGLSKLITIIDGIRIIPKPEDNVPRKIFLAKTDEMFFILRHLYKVERNEAVKYFREIGLAGFVNEWKETKKRPKINTF